MAPAFRQQRGRRVERSPSEQNVWDHFMAGPYQGFGCCMNPACDSPHAVVLTSGKTPSARICVTCFEFDFGCTHPTRGRLDAIRRRRG